MKDIKLKLIAELMKNSRKSDRELAKTIGVSQPTVTRTRTKLEKEGIIKEYTMIPDFNKLGFEIMAVFFTGFKERVAREEMEEASKKVRNMDEKYKAASLMIMRGIGLGYDRIGISLNEDYTSFMKLLTLTKQIPNVDTSKVNAFLISLSEEHYQPLTFSKIADYLLARQENNE